MGVMRATDQVTIVEGGIGDTTELEAKVDELNNNLTANSQSFKFAFQDGQYGYMINEEGVETFMNFANSVITPVIFTLNGYYGGANPANETYTATSKGKCLIFIGTHSPNTETCKLSIKLNDVEKFSYSGSCTNATSESLKSMMIDVEEGDVISVSATSNENSRGGNLAIIIFIS